MQCADAAGTVVNVLSAEERRAMMLAARPRRELPFAPTAVPFWAATPVTRERAQAATRAGLIRASVWRRCMTGCAVGVGRIGRQ